MQPTIKLDVAGFARMVNDLAHIAGVDAKTALRGEVEGVLNNCIKWTPAPKAKVYPRSGKEIEQDGAKLCINSGRRGPEGWIWLNMVSERTGKRASYIIAGGDGRARRWSNQRWALAMSMLDKPTARKLTKGKAKRSKVVGRGLAKASWLQIGDSLGLTLKAPAYVRNAVPSNGRQYTNGFGGTDGDGSRFAYVLTNRYPLLCGLAKQAHKIDGAAILQRSIHSRMSGFKMAMQKGIFSDIKRRAQRYPGLFK